MKEKQSIKQFIKSWSIENNSKNNFIGVYLTPNILNNIYNYITYLETELSHCRAKEMQIKLKDNN